MILKPLIESKTALQTLAKQPLPISVSWELSKFLKASTPHIDTFNELRDAKIRELGEPEIKDEKETGNYTLKSENREAFFAAVEELLNKEVDLVAPQINIKDLLEYKDANGKGIVISSAEMILLGWLFVD